MRKFSFKNVYRLFLPVIVLAITACTGAEDTGTNDPGPRNNTPGVPGSTACLTNSAAYVEANYANVNAWDGGALYDTWWETGAAGAVAPTTTNSLFATQTDNTRTGADTWRCKECHGWDYKGASGAYGPGSDHYTGFKGINGATTKTPIEVYCAIREGSNIDSRHAFNTSTTRNTLTNDAILKLTKFILDTDLKGQINMNEYINPVTGAALGNATLGKSVFDVKAGCGAVNCHGPSGTLNLHEPGETLGFLAVEDPWEMLHKVRNGDPGSSMPAFVSTFIPVPLTKTDMQNVLAYAQTLPGSENANPGPSPTPTACLTDTTTANFVNTNINNVNAWDGGRLYDAWWLEASVGAPTNNHPLWSTQTSNTRTGADTWRCKECHGWDYKGANGAYGIGSSHYTGFPGITNAANKTALQVFCAIRDGEGINTSHKFNAVNTSNGLNDLRILQLTKFIVDTNQRGMIDTNLFINPNTKQALGTASLGQTTFTSPGSCGSSNCHGTDGLLNAGGETIGQIAVDNPWEALHKLRNGHPGSIMPSFVATLSQAQQQNVLAYAQTLPTVSTGTGTCATDMASFVNAFLGNVTPWSGGQLYDNWAAAVGVTPPTTNHPLWSIQNSNTRTGADTWRCKECHGWDYKGVDGAYGPGSNHYTGFTGIYNSINKPAVDLFCAIRDGEGINANHKFNISNTGGAIGDIQILSLVSFMKATGDNGLTNSDLFVNPVTKEALGDATLGQTVYQTKAICDSCHGADGTLNFVGVTLGDLAGDNPWEVIHKVRYGHPGSIMPSYINDALGTGQLTDNDVKNVVTYAQTLPVTPGTGGGTDPANCLTDKAGYVSTNYALESEAQGGALYDKWWAALGFATGPVTNHPLWSQQNTNAATGADTWRCKECHGWDYQGVDGAYGDPASTHYTGFPGILSAQNKQPLDVFCAIYNGTAAYPQHKFNPSNSSLTDQAILQLTKFITSSTANRGLLLTDLYIDPNTGDTINGDATQGQLDFGANCVSCHGTDGTLNLTDETLGFIANDNPWEMFHKIRFGHPGSVPAMPAFIDNNVTLNTMVDIITYAKGLPTTGNVPTPPPVTGIDQIVMGGKLYDHWIDTKGVAAPNGDNPLWAFQNTNNRTGADTWRCKECHGWDYKGQDGQYGPGSSHFTGFNGVFTIAQDATQTEQDVISIITNGFSMPGSSTIVHDYGGLLTAEEIAALAAFIKQGVVNTDLYISPTLGTANGDVTRGLDQYTFTGQFIPKGNCSLCHGDDGQQINFGTTAAPEFLGDLARSDPWEVLHKARFGQPGTIMPSMMQNGLAIENTVDVLTYTQTLPEAPPPPPPPRRDDD